MKYFLFFASALWGSVAEAEAPVQVLAACDAVHYRHSEGSAVVLPDGRALLAWSRFDGPKDRCATLGDNGPATIVLSESTDGGRTWSEPRPLPVGTATVNIMQPSFVPVREGLMLAFSVRMKEGRTSQKFAIDSTDGGRTWSERRHLFDAGGANDRAIRLRSGRLLIAAHRRSDRRIGKDSDRDLFVARSDDEGRTWLLSASVPHVVHAMEQKPSDPWPMRINEPAVAECRDGSLLMLARSSVGVLYESRSTDGGESWLALQPTNIASFAAPPYLRTMADGRIVLLWNPPVGESALAKAAAAMNSLTPYPLGRRERLALMTTRDGGRTWSEPQTVVEDGRYGYCYPCTIERPDGTLQIFCARTPYTIYPCDLVQLPSLRP